MSRVGFAYAVTAAILFGVGGTFAQFLFQQRGVNMEWLVTMRLLCAGSVLLLVCALRQGGGVLAIWRGNAISILLFGLVGMMPVQYTFMAAIESSNAATATTLQFTAPAMIAAWIALTRRRAPDRREMAAMLLAMAGVFFIVTHANLGALSISGIAMFWGLASAVAAAFCAIQPARMLREHNSSLVAGWGMVIGGVALALFRPPWTAEGHWDEAAYASLGVVILLGTLVSFYLSLNALRLIGPQKTSLLTCVEPLAATLLAVLWLGVAWGGMDWLGTACILTTVILLSRDQTKETQAEKVT